MAVGVGLFLLAAASVRAGAWQPDGGYLGLAGTQLSTTGPTTGSTTGPTAALGLAGAGAAGGVSGAGVADGAAGPAGPGRATSPPAGPTDEASRRTRQAMALLQQRAAAVLARDRAAWMATVADSSSDFGGAQARLFDTLMRLGVDRFGYDQIAPSQALPSAVEVGPGGPAWVAKVAGHYALRGFDRGLRDFAASYTFVQLDQGWRIRGEAAGGENSAQVWDLNGLRVIRGASSLVVGNAPENQMRYYGHEADRAVSRVSAVWGVSWPRKVVVFTPATTAQFAQLLGRPVDDGLSQVAAVTQGPLGSGERAGADAVVVNPSAFRQLRPIGRQVVLTHEVTHVAIRASTTQGVPVWLSEGMADYVGYRGTGLSRVVVAAELLARVRRGQGPVALPRAEDYDPGRTAIAPSYSASWLACSRLADLYGQARLVAFYRAVAQTPGGDRDAVASAAFPKLFGVGRSGFVSGWRGYLTRLAAT
ncbi:MAG TPA: hypothetical protein VFJ97_07560 [Dermatophilaceae bacterium]|nr:hypothetical protein [Dermatophilaceae bacterium]